MLDPFPIRPPALLSALTQQYAEKLNLHTLHLHIHEIIFAILLYHVVYKFVSPAVSSRLFPKLYRSLDQRTRLNWDIHVLSLFQSILINALAFYVAIYDEERKHMNFRERIWGYTGANGLIAALVVGYFSWDVWYSAWYINYFGFGLLAHAVSALAVYSFGFRPFVNYYAPNFILFELSTPFLNFHWFFDKLNMTGSQAQFINGIILTSTFFGARLVWGSYSSYRVFADMYRGLRYQDTLEGGKWLETLASDVTARAASAIGGEPAGEVLRYAQKKRVPMWMALIYVLSNITLMSLNVVWFSKMIETIRKRFDPPLGTRKPEKEEQPVMGRGLYDDGTKTVEIIDSKKVRRRIPIDRLPSDLPPPT